jgi:hypothetical protein
VKRGIVLFAIATSLLVVPGPAVAKGKIPSRGYAVLTGPGLQHPIVYVAPWAASNGGYYGDSAELFLALATYTGALPAGRNDMGGGSYVPDGVLPLDSAPRPDTLGPSYRLTWFRDGVPEVAEQTIYPYAIYGPDVYTFPSSRHALISLFGRFQDPAHLWTGWGETAPLSRRSLRGLLEAKGLPETAPSGAGPQALISPRPTTGAIVGGSPATSRVPSALFALAVLLVLGAAVFWLRRRQHVLGGL